MDFETQYDISPVGPLGVIAMKGCEELGATINDYLKEWRYNDEGFLIGTSCPRFISGESKAIINHSVRGYDIFIICDCYNYGVTFKMYDKTVNMSPDDHYRDLVRTISALSGKPHRINVIMPMLYGSRQDKRITRESLDCAVSLQELVNMGVSNILTFDAHEPRVQNAIPLSGFDTITPSYQMIKALYSNVGDIELTNDKALIISPDEGGMKRCMYYSSLLGLDLGMFYKRRDYSVIVNGRNPIVKHEFLGNDVADKDIIIVDDIIATGDSMLEVARQLKEMQAKRIFMFITFGQFCNGTALFDKAYEEGVIDKIFVTNTTYKPEEIQQKPWFCNVDISKYLSRLIDTLNMDKSISALLNPIKKINYLKKANRQIMI